MGCAEKTVDGRQGASCGRSDLCAKQDANYGGLVPDGADCLPSSCHVDLSFLVSTALKSRPNSKQWIKVSLCWSRAQIASVAVDKMSDNNHAMELRWRAPGHSANPQTSYRLSCYGVPMKYKQGCKELVPVNTISTPHKTRAAAPAAAPISFHSKNILLSTPGAPRAGCLFKSPPASSQNIPALSQCL